MAKVVPLEVDLNNDAVEAIAHVARNATVLRSDKERSTVLDLQKVRDG